MFLFIILLFIITSTNSAQDGVLFLDPEPAPHPGCWLWGEMKTGTSLFHNLLVEATSTVIGCRKNPLSTEQKKYIHRTFANLENLRPEDQEQRVENVGCNITLFFDIVPHFAHDITMLKRRKQKLIATSRDIIPTWVSQVNFEPIKRYIVVKSSTTEKSPDIIIDLLEKFTTKYISMLNSVVEYPYTHSIWSLSSLSERCDDSLRTIVNTCYGDVLSPRNPYTLEMAHKDCEMVLQSHVTMKTETRDRTNLTTDEVVDILKEKDKINSLSKYVKDNLNEGLQPFVKLTSFHTEDNGNSKQNNKKNKEDEPTDDSAWNWVNNSFFVRIQKTASTSFSDLCSKQKTGLRWCDIAFRHHIDYINMRRLANRDSLFVTWLRSPHHRVISEYRDVLLRTSLLLKQKQWDYHPDSNLTRRLMETIGQPEGLRPSLEDFIGYPSAPANNRMVRYLGDEMWSANRPIPDSMHHFLEPRDWPTFWAPDKWPPPVEEYSFNKAALILNTGAVIIGIVEDYDCSVCILAEKLGWEVVPEVSLTHNVNQKKEELYEPKEEDTELIHKMNKWDVKLYNVGLGIHFNRVSQIRDNHRCKNKCK